MIGSKVRSQLMPSTGCFQMMNVKKNHLISSTWGNVDITFTKSIAFYFTNTVQQWTAFATFYFKASEIFYTKSSCSFNKHFILENDHNGTSLFSFQELHLSRDWPHLYHVHWRAMLFPSGSKKTRNNVLHQEVPILITWPKTSSSRVPPPIPKRVNIDQFSAYEIWDYLRAFMRHQGTSIPRNTSVKNKAVCDNSFLGSG